MSDEPKRTVWILGSGFSKALGGPLLDELLSPVGATAVSAIYQKLRIGPPQPMMHLSALIDAIDAHRRRNGTPWWRDAEDFLDQLDAIAGLGEAVGIHSAEWGGLRKIFQQLEVDAGPRRSPRGYPMTPGLEVSQLAPISLHAAARRFAAAQCCAFLEGANTKEERWSPYRRWARELTGTAESGFERPALALKPPTLPLLSGPRRLRADARFSRMDIRDSRYAAFSAGIAALPLGK
jgi:hypothetical protein